MNITKVIKGSFIIYGRGPNTLRGPLGKTRETPFSTRIWEI